MKTLALIWLRSTFVVGGIHIIEVLVLTGIMGVVVVILVVQRSEKDIELVMVM